MCNHDCFNCTYDDCIAPETEDYADALTDIDNAIKDNSIEKQKARERAKRYADKHREELREKSRRYYYSHREEQNAKAIERSKRYYSKQKQRKREKWNENPELAREKQRKQRKAARDKLPHCDQCDMCRAIVNSKGDGDLRLCMRHWQLIERKVTSSPRWCELREKMKVS